MKLLTSAEVAKMLGLTVSTFSQRIMKFRRSGGIITPDSYLEGPKKNGNGWKSERIDEIAKAVGVNLTAGSND